MAERMGFERLRQRGSHVRFGHSDGRKLTVPHHRGQDLKTGVYHEILKALGISEEEFNRLR